MLPNHINLNGYEWMKNKGKMIARVFIGLKFNGGFFLIQRCNLAKTKKAAPGLP